MQAEGFSKSAGEFISEAGVTMEGVNSGMLEKKWSSVVRLQKKVSCIHESKHAMYRVRHSENSRMPCCSG